MAINLPLASKREALAIMVLVLTGWSVTSLAQEQDKQQSAELVEMGREMRKAALALDDIREIMVQAANLDTTNLDANMEAGVLHLTTVHKDQALRYLRRVYNINPGYRTDLDFYIGLSYHYGMRFGAAIDFYNKFRARLVAGKIPKTRVSLDALDRKIEECVTGKELVAKPKSYIIENLGAAVNSEADDYSPSLDEDGDLLVFTSRRRDGNINSDVSLVDNKPFEDIFLSRKVGDKWMLATNIGAPVNTPLNDSDLGFSPSGKVLYTYAKGDIYSTGSADGVTWSVPEPLPYPVNTDSTEKGFSITADGQMAVFASRRAGGIGGLDIYAVYKQKDGSWGTAQNLGPAINTEHNEESPYIDPTGKVLFYSSNGKRGMGGYDVFRSTLISQKTGSWSEPENLGYPINTPDDDLYFIGSKDEKRGYFASVREGGFGYLDIYRIGLPGFLPVQPAILPIKVTVAVKDEKTGEQIMPVLQVLHQKTKTTAASPVFDGKNAIFYIRAKEKQTYTVNIIRKGYEPKSIDMDIEAASTSGGFQSLEVKIKPIIEAELKPSQPTSEPKKPEIKPVQESPRKTEISSGPTFFFFQSGTVIMVPESETDFKRLITYLLSNPGISITINSHTDNIGPDTYNLQLSAQRAETIRLRLEKAGIASSRITTKALGESVPLLSNDDEIDGRQYNRRIEVRYRK